MAETTKYSSFRMQTCRLAWLTVFAMLAVVVLMWIFGHDANRILAKAGFGFFFAAIVFSVMCRRLHPFLAALVGLILLLGSVCV